MRAAQVAVPRLASTALLLANSQDLGLPQSSPLLARSYMKPNDIHVLMVRRHNKARFMPEMYVFPGGGVDDEDADVAADVGFTSKAALVGVQAEDKRLREAWASRVAALRELSEETSCVLHADNSIESREDWQSSEDGKKSGRPFDASAAPQLTPLGRWITPEDNRYRYDTYFYGAALRSAKEVGRDHRLPPQLVKLQSQEREISTLLWVSPLEALIRHELPEESFTLPPPTFHLLSALARVPSFAWLADQWHQRQQGLLPTDKPEELLYHPVTPGSLSRDEGKEVVYFQLPEHCFHNVGPDGALTRGHYQMPIGSAARGTVRYVDLYVGDRDEASPARPISFLRPSP